MPKYLVVYQSEAGERGSLGIGREDYKESEVFNAANDKSARKKFLTISAMEN